MAKPSQKNTAPDTSCPAPSELKIANLYGTWVLEISSADGTQILLRGRVELEKIRNMQARSAAGYICKTAKYL